MRPSLLMPLLLLAAICGSSARKLQQNDTKKTIMCRGGMCYVKSVTSGSAQPTLEALDFSGINSVGECFCSFACFKGKPAYDVEDIAGAVTPSVSVLPDGGMTCVSSSPLQCDSFCCSVNEPNVTAKSCLGIPAEAPAPAPGEAPSAQAAAPAPLQPTGDPYIQCSLDSCSAVRPGIGTQKLDTTGIETTGTYAGLFVCWRPPSSLPLAMVEVNGQMITPGTATSTNKGMQCVGDGQLFCDLSCCTQQGTAKKSCLTLPI